MNEISTLSRREQLELWKEQKKRRSTTKASTEQSGAKTPSVSTRDKPIRAMSGGAKRVLTPSKSTIRSKPLRTASRQSSLIRPSGKEAVKLKDPCNLSAIPTRVLSSVEDENHPPVIPSRSMLKPQSFSTTGKPERVVNPAQAGPRRVLTSSLKDNSDSDEEKPMRKWCVDDFVMGKKLGKGKFGNVYLAKEKATGVVVALKVLFKSILVQDEGIQNLRREVEIQSRLKHPNIIRLYGYFHNVTNICLILEYAPKGEVFKVLRHAVRFTEVQAQSYTLQVANALHYCHCNHVIHRDLKPENLLIGDDNSIKLADFGWSVHAPRPYDRRSTMCCTPEYLSPEMVLQEKHDFRIDIWSLGVLLYEFLVGTTPFAAPTQLQMYELIKAGTFSYPTTLHLSLEAKDLITNLLQRDAKNRLPLDKVLLHPWFQSL